MNKKWIFLLTLFFLSQIYCVEKEVGNKEKLVEYLEQLVRFQTLPNDFKENKKALLWVEEQLQTLPLHFTSHNFNGHSTLLITTQPTKKPRLWLVGHMDIVSAPEEMFEPVIKNGIMYGRGVYDMKMAIASFMLLVHELKDQLGEYDFGIMLTSDEEIGGMNGVEPLLEMGYTSDVAFLPDGGFNWNFEEEAKGVLHLKIKSEGLSAHGSRPWLGENAINKLMNFLQAVNHHFDEERKSYSDYFPTVNVGVIQGGKSTNQVPDYAEAKIDIRFPSSIPQEQVYEKVQKIANKYDKVSIEKLIDGSPHKVDLNLAPFKKFRNLAYEMYGIEVGTVKSHGATDARFFGEKKIPVLVISPRGGDIHSDHEWVDLDDSMRFYEVMKDWVKEVSKTQKNHSNLKNRRTIPSATRIPPG